MTSSSRNRKAKVPAVKSGLIGNPSKPVSTAAKNKPKSVQTRKAKPSVSQPAATQVKTEPGDNAPRPLALKLGSATPAPMTALGAELVPVANAIQRVVQAPPALVMSSLLAVLALIAQGQVNVRTFHGSIKPAALFLLNIGESGLRKSSVDNFALQGVDLVERHLRELALEDQLSFAKAQIIVRTGSLEGILRTLQNGRGSMGLFNDDSGSFFGGSAMSAENRMKSTAWLSQIWDGSSVSHNLSNSENNIHMSGRRLSVYFGLQPALFLPLLDDSTFFHEGILGRILISAPDSNIGYREIVDVDPADLAVIEGFAQKVKSHLLRALPYQNSKDAALGPRTIELSPGAKRVLMVFSAQAETAQRPGGAFSELTGPASKFTENATRIAAVLSYFENPEGLEVSEEQAARAVKLMVFYATEMRRIVSVRKLGSSIAAAQKLLGWLHDRRSGQEISYQDFYNFGPYRRAELNLPLVQILEEHGWLRRLKGNGYAGAGDVWKIIPMPPIMDPFAGLSNLS